MKTCLSKEYCTEVEEIYQERISNLENRTFNGSIDSNKVQSVLCDCERFICDYIDALQKKKIKNDEDDNLDYNEIEQLMNPKQAVLNPNEINKFYDLSGKIKAYGRYRNLIPTYINELIQKSYDAGHNDFFFVFGDKSAYNFLGSCLDGTINNPIEISFAGNCGSNFCLESNNVCTTILGDVGHYFGLNSSNLKAFVKGNVMCRFGGESKNLSVFLEGNCESLFGRKSNNLTAIIQGDVEKYFGFESQYLAANIKGNVEESFGNRCGHMVAEVDGDMNVCGSFSNAVYSTLSLLNEELLWKIDVRIRNGYSDRYPGFLNFLSPKKLNYLILKDEEKEKLIARFYIRW
jgi:hypothetical protein